MTAVEVLDFLKSYFEANPETVSSIVFLDVDNFHGLAKESQNCVLQKINEYFCEYVRNTEYNFCWIGRDEFLLILPNLSKTVAKKWIDNLLIHFSQTFSSQKLTCSAGIVQYPWDSTEITELWRKAEAVLNKAKRQGRNCACLVSEEKMILRSSYYTSEQLNRLRYIAQRLNKKEAEILREILENFLNENGI